MESALPLPSRAPLSGEPFPTPAPSFAVRAAVRLRQALRRAVDAVTPVELILLERATGLALTHVLAAVAHLGVADALGEQALTAQQLAPRVGADADLLHRSLRALAAQGFFTLDARGRFHNNRLSRALASGTLTRLREALLYFASSSNAAAWADFGRTLTTGASAFERVHGATVWDWFDAHPHEREVFASMMMGITALDAPVIARSFPFAEAAVVCDVGGGRGTLLSEVLLRHPHLRGILSDAPGVLDSARELLERRGVAARVTLTPGSFFEGVPAGADTYLLKNILHDWDDATCLRILSRVRAGMGARARLLVCETLLERNDTHPLRALADLQMAVACSGRERSLEDFRALLSRAGLRLGRVFPSETTSVLEALPEG
jgi:hypothetical protein